MARFSIVGVPLALTLSALAMPAEACRVSLSPGERIAFGYQSGAISSVVQVQVEASEDTTYGWHAATKVTNVLRGELAKDAVEFEVGFNVNVCDGRYAIAKPGDFWVVYMWEHPQDGQVPWQAYPADIAFTADPLLPLQASLPSVHRDLP